MIVITGATGFVGREVVKQAVKDGFKVRIVAREPHHAAPLVRDYGVEFHHGNVLHAPSLEGAFDGAEAVVHLVGIIRERGENTFEHSHTLATKNVVEAAQTAKDRRFIHMSSLGTRAHAASRYHKTKWAAEEIVRAAELRWTILRPSVIYGPEDEFVRELSRFVRHAPFAPVIGPGHNKLQPIGVDEVAHCVLAAIKNDDSIDQTYDLCGPVAYEMNEIVDIIMETMGVLRKKRHIPLPLARWLATVFELMLPVPPFTRDQLIMLGEDDVGNPRPMAETFHFTPRAFAQGIASYLRPI